MFAVMFLGAFAADAGRVGEDGTGAMWVAPELLEALNAGGLPGCVSFTNGRVAFEWHPATGELSFAAETIEPPITLPEGFSSEPLTPTANCGSR